MVNRCLPESQMLVVEWRRIFETTPQRACSLPLPFKEESGRNEIIMAVLNSKALVLDNGCMARYHFWNRPTGRFFGDGAPDWLE